MEQRENEKTPLEADESNTHKEKSKRKNLSFEHKKSIFTML